MVASIAPSLQRPRLRCCDASSCRAAGSGALLKALETARSNGGEAAELLEIKPVGCLRLCSQGPLVALDRPEGQSLYGGLSAPCTTFSPSP